MSDTNLCWVCPCPESAQERVRTSDITAITPSGRCRFCGRNYAEANAEIVREITAPAGWTVSGGYEEESA